MKITQVKVVNFLEVLNELKEIHGDDMYHKMWDHIAGSIFGNQRFANDSTFVYMFASINGEPMTELEKILHDHCKEAIENHELYLDVCW